MIPVISVPVFHICFIQSRIWIQPFSARIRIQDPGLTKIMPKMKRKYQKNISWFRIIFQKRKHFLKKVCWFFVDIVISSKFLVPGFWYWPSFWTQIRIQEVKRCGCEYRSKVIMDPDTEHCWTASRGLFLDCLSLYPEICQIWSFLRSLKLPGSWQSCKLQKTEDTSCGSKILAIYTYRRGCTHKLFRTDP